MAGQKNRGTPRIGLWLHSPNATVVEEAVFWRPGALAAIFHPGLRTLQLPGDPDVADTRVNTPCLRSSQNGGCDGNTAASLFPQPKFVSLPNTEPTADQLEFTSCSWPHFERKDKFIYRHSKVTFVYLGIRMQSYTIRCFGIFTR